MVKQKRSGGAWYYEFMHRGKRFFGTCEGATNKRDAEAYERGIRDKVKQAAGLKSVKALYETFREDLTGGKVITLDEAFDLAEKKPRSRMPGDKHSKMKRKTWEDFLAFMHGEHPEAVNLADVTDAHAQEYIALLQTSGRYKKITQYTIGKGKNAVTITRQSKPIRYAAHTINLYNTFCAEVFSLLAKDAGLQSNPFSSIRKAKSDRETREAFTPEELKKIYDNLDSFTRPLFMFAVWTGLREGDICTIKWSEIDLDRRLITRKTRKTGVKVQIPISDQLYRLLITTPHTDSEYVFPKHADLYLTTQSAVSYRVKKFLNGLGIQTTRQVDGRTRVVSVKDLHSCRHTFCYYAGLAGIPLAVVQSIVGHMTPAMTEHYSAHASLEDKRRGMERLSFFNPALPEPAEEPERAKLRQLVNTLSLEQIRFILDNIPDNND